MYVQYPRTTVAASSMSSVEVLYSAYSMYCPVHKSAELGILLSWRLVWVLGLETEKSRSRHYVRPW